MPEAAAVTGALASEPSIYRLSKLVADFASSMEKRDLPFATDESIADTRKLT